MKLAEAARVDGCGEFKIFTKIYSADQACAVPWRS